MKENLTGLFLSGLLHAGIIGWAANATYMPQKEKIHVQSHQLTVSLFQAENIIKKPTIKKVIVPAPSKEPIEVKPPKSSEKIKPVKPITVAAIKPVIAIEKTQPIIKAEVPQTIKQAQNKILEKPVKKRKQIAKKVVKKITPKNKKKRIKKPVKAKHKPVKKRTIVRHKKKRVTPKKTLKVVAKSKLQPKARARIAPKRKPVVRVQRKSKTIRKAPVTRKVVKKGGVVNPNKSYKRPNTKRQQAVQAHKNYRKPTQHHISPPIRRSNVNTTLVANLNKQYKAQLHRLIANATKKNYPKRAKRRNQQGRVRLSFTISHSGTITNIKILKSSNIAVLDKAAIKTIQKTSRKLPFLSGMPKSSLHLTMTVAYVLR